MVRDEDIDDNNFLLESLCEREGIKLWIKSYNQKNKTQHEYFRNTVDKVISQYALPHRAYKNITNFLIDSYIYHHRHVEKDIRESINDSYRDSFVYLVRLNNHFPLTYRRMTDYGF